MSSQDQEFQKRLLATFRVEAREHLTAITGGLVSLEKAAGAGERSGILETLIREAHSLKGAARAVDHRDIEGVCQSLESVFAALKRVRSPSPELFDALHRTGDLLLDLLAEQGAGPGGKPPVAEIIGSLQALLQDEPAAKLAVPAAEPAGRAAVHPEPAPAAGAETVRVATAKLDALLGQAEEMLYCRLAAGQQAARLREHHRKLSRLRKALPQSDRAMLERDLASIAAETEELARTAERDLQSLSAAADELIGAAKKLLMQPFSATLDLLPKLIRDLTRQQGKEAELRIRGAEIEIDKRILEEMKDPFIHLVRNCIDHGIEPPAERRSKDKPRQGTVSISCLPKDSGNVEILIEDDGAGIDCAKVKAAAVRIGILSGERAEELSEAEALPLIFHSGLTTSPLLTDVSGRGLGLAIALEKVEKLGGRISVNQRAGEGTAFRIALPLTLASFRAVIVQAGEQQFAFPAAGVERVVEVRSEEVRTVENREAFRLGTQVVALVRLRDLLELPGAFPSAEPEAKLPAVVLGTAGIAVLVDQVLDEQEILVKSLGSQLRRVRNLAGAAVLGTGRPVPVLNIPDLIKSAQKLSEGGLKPAARVAGSAERSKSVLLVEDSITSRILLKGILENAGYEVGLAVDGLDALSRLRGGSFDLVVSDVQMPRMNGFDLTAAIRGDKKLGEVPVVLVTALESREDRERGIEVGANAYIVKSSFDQGDLLEIIGRLL